MIWCVLTNGYIQVTITTARDPDHHFSGSRIVFIIVPSISDFPCLGLGNHWFAYYHFRLDLSFLEFHMKKWPYRPSVRFLFYLNTQFECHWILPWLSLILYSALSTHCCIMLYYNLFLQILILLTKLYDPWGQDHCFYSGIFKVYHKRVEHSRCLVVNIISQKKIPVNKYIILVFIIIIIPNHNLSWYFI